MAESVTLLVKRNVHGSVYRQHHVLYISYSLFCCCTDSFLLLLEEIKQAWTVQKVHPSQRFTQEYNRVNVLQTVIAIQKNSLFFSGIIFYKQRCIIPPQKHSF